MKQRYSLASRWKRLLASMIDGIILLAVISVVILAIHLLGGRLSNMGSIKTSVLSFAINCSIFFAINGYWLAKTVVLDMPTVERSHDGPVESAC